MKPLLILGLLLGSLAPLTAEGVQKEGHTPGAFTMDYDAALAYAKAKDLPILWTSPVRTGAAGAN